MSEPKKNQPIMRIQRITLPRYEVEYPLLSNAYAQARDLKEKKLLIAEALFREPVNQEIVLDLGAEELTLRTTFLFRLKEKKEARTIFEWWPRRRTDHDLLELWIAGLHQALEKEQEPPNPSLPPVELQLLYELCRRAASNNPFNVLGLPVTATTAQVNQAYHEAIRMLERYENYPHLESRVTEFLSMARNRLDETRRNLSTLESRQRQRAEFVPKTILRAAIETVEARLRIARLMNDDKEVFAAQLLLQELLG